MLARLEIANNLENFSQDMTVYTQVMSRRRFRSASHVPDDTAQENHVPISSEIDHNALSMLRKVLIPSKE